MESEPVIIVYAIIILSNSDTKMDSVIERASIKCYGASHFSELLLSNVRGGIYIKDYNL